MTRKALAIHGQRGKQRSVHNTYFTLPVVFAMLSNHYGFLYSHPQRWLVLLLMMLAGALIRQFFVQTPRMAFAAVPLNPWPFAAVGVVLILGVIRGFASCASSSSVANEAVSFAQVQAIVAERCVSLAMDRRCR
jgi:uncharacterized membrane protein